LNLDLRGADVFLANVCAIGGFEIASANAADSTVIQGSGRGVLGFQGSEIRAF
jgi:hypothetical protein